MQLIARADEKGDERLTDKTAKRHLSTLSQYLKYAVDKGHLTFVERGEMVGAHTFVLEDGARKQRDAWTSDEPKTLFTSPVWTGCHPTFRSAPGDQIMRDAKFWLPLLALHHGARVEQFADLYGRDIFCDDGTWTARLVVTSAPNADSSRWQRGASSPCTRKP